jgi:DNA-binding LacI/PurR family transcriptional regulator
MVVSRVCNPSPKEYVSEASRERVLKAIEELGYRPDMRARSLRRQRNDTIGYYSGYGTVWLWDEFARVIFDGLQEATAEYNQDLLIYHALDREPALAAAMRIMSTKIDGLVYLPKPDDTELSRLLAQTNKPVVRIGEPYPGIPAVVAGDVDGGKRLARHLYLRGHRRVVFRNEPGNRVSSRRREYGFREAAEQLGMDVTVTIAADADYLTDIEKDMILNRKSEGITAVACWHDLSAAQVVLFCRENRIQIPDDLAVTGFDGLFPPVCPPDVRITTIVVDWEYVAYKAVSQLIELVEKREIPQETIVRCSFLNGNTT